MPLITVVLLLFVSVSNNTGSGKFFPLMLLCNGNRTAWCSIRSVILRVMTENRTTMQRESDLFITSKNKNYNF